MSISQYDIVTASEYLSEKKKYRESVGLYSGTYRKSLSGSW